MINRYVDLVGEPRFINRNGCRVGYRVAGDTASPITLLLFSAWQIVHSGAWKGMVPYLSQFYRVIAIDCRGNGLSDRPNETAAYHPRELVEDALTILDREQRQSAVVMGFSYGGHLAAMFAASHPERSNAAVLFAPSAPFGPNNPALTFESMTAKRESYAGWEQYNFNYWQQHYPEFAEFFVREVFPENYSEKQIEDALDWAAETDPKTLAHTIAARADREGQGPEMYRSIGCPVLLVQGTEDSIVPVEKGRLVAELCDARYVELPGVGHMPVARIPAKMNELVREFVDAVLAVPVEDRSLPKIIKARNRKPKALYLSSPIGLGHVRRDRAIADALRERRPELEIDWLAQAPVTSFLEASGERVHPLSASLLSESQHIESESGEHDLNAFQALRRMDAILVTNFCLFQDVVNSGEYDLVIADEAWDIDRFWHEHPELKKTKLAWMTDFVGVLPMTTADSQETRLARDWNAEMIDLIDRAPGTRDAAIFIGEQADVVDMSFGEGLPSIREWTAATHQFSGYINPVEGLPEADRDQLRRALGFADGEIVCLVAVGGSGVGRTLIRRLLEIVPLLRARVPALAFQVVTGPRIDPNELPRIEGVHFRAFVADFISHVRACDVAIVQGGLSTTMELTCLGKPFLYVPLEQHFEQQIHVHHRLQRYGFGERLRYAELSDAERLAVRIENLLARHARPATTDLPAFGAALRAADAIAALI